MSSVASDDPVQLLKALIACPSVTPEAAGVFDALETALTPLGFAVTRLRFEGNGSYPVDNLFAIRDRGGRKLLFAGHTDVVPPGDIADWTADPFVPREADGRLYGRGAADMKSGVASFVAACARAIAAGEADTGTIALAITNDEEAEAINGTDRLMAWTREQDHAFDFALVGEPSSTATLGDSIKIGRRGSMSGSITVEGVQGHAAYPEKANNPLPVIAAIVTALKAEPVDTGTAHFPATNLEVTTIDVGNPASNVIPARGTLKFNVRFNDLWSPESLSQWLADCIAGVDAKGCTVRLETQSRPSRVFRSPLSADVDLLSKVIKAETGQRPALSTGGGTSDARFIAQYCPVVECGLVGTSMHKADEHVALADVEGLTRIYQRFIARFLTGGAA